MNNYKIIPVLNANQFGVFAYQDFFGWILSFSVNINNQSYDFLFLGLLYKTHFSSAMNLRKLIKGKGTELICTKPKQP